MQIAIVYSLPSKRLLTTQYGETDEDSAIIARVVAKGLGARGQDVTIYPIAEDKIEMTSKIKADCIFNLIEWCGEDIELSMRAFECFRKLKIPVTGSGGELFALTGDKIRAKHELQKMRVPTPQGQVFETGDEEIDPLTYPVIVKPSLEHCSMGLTYDSIAREPKKLREIVKRQIQIFHQRALAEEFIVGRELLVYLLEEKDRVRVLPIEEVIFSNNNPLAFQTYESKWDKDHVDYQTSKVVVAELGKEEQKIVESTCVKVFKEMGFRGYARLDVRLRDNIPYLLETNVNPSVYDSDEELKDINQEVIPGIKFGDYLMAIVESAVYHYERGSSV